MPNEMKTLVPSGLMPTHMRADISFAKGKGTWLEGSDGRQYLDFASGIAVTALGHGHPRLASVLRDYADRPWHLSNFYRIPEQEQVALALTGHSFANRAFFCNSGAEASEAAIKVARRAQFCEGARDRIKIVTLEGAFHGRTYGALAATGNPKYMEGFGPPLEGFEKVRSADMSALKDAVDARTAAVMIEPIQGEGGIRVLPEDYVRAVRQLCTDRGALLIFDEVQCGMGRTGTLFAYEQYGVAPDILTLAKGLGGGFPVGALIATERVSKHMQPGTHGSTFGGNALGMAVAHAVLQEMLSPGFLSRVSQASKHLERGLQQLLQKHPSTFSEVRGRGLLRGLKCIPQATELVAKARDAQLLLTAAGDNVLRLLPPLNVTDEEIDEAVRRISAAASTS